MEFRQLEVFCKVAELKSFTKAAEAIYLTQPTVSSHIQYLENLWDVKLFDRTARMAKLTKAGELLFQYAKEILRLRQEMQNAMEEFSGTIRGNLEVGGSSIPGNYILPRLIGLFKEAYPQAQISLQVSDTKGIVKALLEDEIELGVVGAHLPDPRLRYEVFAREELVLIVPPDHKWANRQYVELADLIQEPLIFREKGSGTRMITEQGFADKNISLKNLQIIAEMGSTEAIKQAVVAGIGVSILSYQAVLHEVKCRSLVALTVQDMSLFREFYIVYPQVRTLSPLAKAFIQFLLRHKMS
ncbi:MAG TPA: selenium metabolism-associated LysR family transcriptional regulator [Candidatus Limnocylindrales bacterium]|nr:selenium metabolism-associated LysR family transcriptional regulator [Candidatus Limnocylindrales bacterium]